MRTLRAGRAQKTTMPLAQEAEQPERILHFTAGLDRAGTETLLLNIYKKVDRHRVQFDFLVWDDRTYDLEDDVRTLGGRVFRAPNTGKKTLSFIFAAWCLMRKHKFSAVHAHVHYWNGVFLPLAWLTGIPVRICHSHNTSDGRRLPPNALRRAFNKLMKLSIRMSSTSLLAPAVATGVALFGKMCTSDRRFRLLNNAVNIDEFERLKPREWLKQELNLRADAILIGNVGRLEHQKNQTQLIKMFDVFRRRFFNSHLIIAGKGPLRAELQLLVNNLGIEEYVHFLGTRGDAIDVISAVDLFVFPSLFEGLGIVAIEAQAAGIPVIASEAIPSEADLQLGLLERVSLQASLGNWVEAFVRGLLLRPTDWATRRKTLERLGYSIDDVAKELESLYLRGRQKRST